MDENVTVAETSKEDEIKPEQGMVIYTDGGSKPNPGDGGWGIHGYLYTTEKSKKGSGCPDFVLTANGYILKTFFNTALETKSNDFTPEVTPISYVDGYGSFSDTTTNNVAELTAATQAFLYAEQYSLKIVRIYSDSEQVCKGLNNWAQNWKDNGWRTKSGTEPANLEIWKTLLELRNRLIARGTDVRVIWVKAHTENEESEGYFGNNIVDKLATLGVMYSKSRISRNDITTLPAEGYWKYVPERHPFLANRRMYFNTSTNFISPGEYYLGEHDKDDDMLGKKISDGAYAVIKLAKPDPVIEMVRNHQSVLSNNIDTLIMLRVDQLFKPGIHKEIAKHGSISLVRSNPYLLSLECLDKKPLTLELKPPRIAMRAVEATSELSLIMIKYLNKDPSITCTDLTTILYETEVKIDKKKVATTSLKLKPEYNVGYAALKNVMANYTLFDGTTGSTDVTLTLGFDLLDRNALKRLEELNPKVTLITWMESEVMFRYATVIEAGEDMGIWCSYYSNAHLLRSKEKIEKKKSKKK